MEDPGAQFARWLPRVPVVLTVFVVIAAAALLVWLGPVAIILVVVCALVALLVWAVAALWLWSAAEQRRRANRYVICEADYADAPRQIKSMMRRIYRSAQSVRSGQAYQRDMFGDLGLDHLVYSAAERAILSSELAAAARDLRPDARPNDRALLDDANVQIKAIKDELAAVEATFKRSAKTADTLSDRITEPERQRAAELANEEAAAAARDRRERARSRLDEVTTRASTRLDVEHGGIEDTVGSVASGYDEARQISDGVLGEGRQDDPCRDDATNESTNAPRAAMLKAANRAAGKATKFSLATAKAGADKLKNRYGGPSPKQ